MVCNITKIGGSESLSCLVNISALVGFFCQLALLGLTTVLGQWGLVGTPAGAAVV